MPPKKKATKNDELDAEKSSNLNYSPDAKRKVRKVSKEERSTKSKLSRKTGLPKPLINDSNEEYTRKKKALEPPQKRPYKRKFASLNTLEPLPEPSKVMKRALFILQRERQEKSFELRRQIIHDRYNPNVSSCELEGNELPVFQEDFSDSEQNEMDVFSISKTLSSLKIQDFGPIPKNHPIPGTVFKISSKTKFRDESTVDIHLLEKRFITPACKRINEKSSNESEEDQVSLSTDPLLEVAIQCANAIVRKEKSSFITWQDDPIPLVSVNFPTTNEACKFLSLRQLTIPIYERAKCFGFPIVPHCGKRILVIKDFDTLMDEGTIANLIQSITKFPVLAIEKDSHNVLKIFFHSEAEAIVAKRILSNVVFPSLAPIENEQVYRISPLDKQLQSIQLVSQKYSIDEILRCRTLLCYWVSPEIERRALRSVFGAHTRALSQCYVARHELFLTKAYAFAVYNTVSDTMTSFDLLQGITINGQRIFVTLLLPSNPLNTVLKNIIAKELEMKRQAFETPVFHESLDEKKTCELKESPNNSIVTPQKNSLVKSPAHLQKNDSTSPATLPISPPLNERQIEVKHEPPNPDVPKLLASSTQITRKSIIPSFTQCPPIVSSSKDSTSNSASPSFSILTKPPTHINPLVQFQHSILFGNEKDSGKIIERKKKKEHSKHKRRRSKSPDAKDFPKKRPHKSHSYRE